MNKSLLDQIGNVERLARSSKINRLMNAPAKYVRAIFFRQYIYPKHKKELVTTARLFYGREMKIALPASTDIYLTGGKSHDSEIRLAKFLILNLTIGDHFLDIGAHYGYFTLLASYIVGNEGKIISFEPSDKTYSLLKENTQSIANITAYKKAVSNTSQTLVFYEFPNLYSEYNSADVSQFENESWFKESKPRKVEVPATTIDELLSDNSFSPKIVKIDVEGEEYHVMQGALNFIKNGSAILVMEYLAPDRHNEAHKKALHLLQEYGYGSYKILPGGELEAVSDIDAYLTSNHLESDNIVFKKGNTNK